MNVLEPNLRNKLENTVKAARDMAEEAAKAALEQIGVGQKEKPPWLDEIRARFRVRLRAHGRQLGDVRYADRNQEINHLVVETAYEHWHRMLFARFLAENHLLIHPDGVPVSLQDCDELAPEEGAKSGWELAGRYASRMLPQVFRQDSPVFEITLAPEHQKGLEKLLSDLPAEVFTADDSLGWVYQFWQARRKDEVNRSEVKIGADELPAVTQLFTEDYMVQFLLHNSLGAWWVANHPGKAYPVELAYLRTLENGTPAAGTFDGWPKRAAELRMLDPCTGSGHFLVAAFYILVPMRMEEDGLCARDACDAVLKENLFGLEIDSRCIEIAAFNLALAAWTYPEAGCFRVLPEMNLACCGLPMSASREEWIAFANGDRRLGDGMAALYKIFSDASTLGSLINPRKLVQGDLVIAGHEELKPLLEKALEKENSRGNVDRLEIGVTAQGLTKAAHLLGEKYHLVATNVPYLAKGRQAEKLKSFCESFYSTAKNDLATVFLERCLEFCTVGGIASLVLPQNWLFLSKYKKLRKELLVAIEFKLIARLGAHAFQTPMWDFNVQLLVMSNSRPGRASTIHGLDVSMSSTARCKEASLNTSEMFMISQAIQLNNPDSGIHFVKIDTSKLLSDYARPYHGISTTDYMRFGRLFWELQYIDNQWIFQQGTFGDTHFYSGKQNILLWEDGKGQLFNLSRTKAPVVITGLEGWGKYGVAITQMGKLPCTIYTGTAFDDNTGVLIPTDCNHLTAIWCFCSSEEYHDRVREIDQTLKVTYPTLGKVSFDLAYWQKIAEERYPTGLPKPYSDDPTQWIFHGHPVPSSATLQVSVARLLGYKWPAETDKGMELAPEAKDLIKKCRKLDPFTDDNGIVCIPAVRGQKPAAERLLSLLAAAYGEVWSPSKLADLLASAECNAKTLEVWLRDKFFEQHFKLFHHRPFIWHIWDGQRDGFSALLNYHKLTRQNLEKLTYTYLGDWLNRQEDGIRQSVDGARVRLLAAQKLKSELEKILEGEKPYDIFVRWKPLHEQPIGWEPDLNDGVRLNIRPFMTAGILRKNPNINWNKDRGKDVESAPWYHLFKGDRINDHHLSLAEKKTVGDEEKKEVNNA